MTQKRAKLFYHFNLNLKEVGIEKSEWENLRNEYVKNKLLRNTE